MFSKEWDVLYADDRQMSRWPWSDLVSLCMRHVEFRGRETKVLELGCGAGANIPFFVSLGVQYFAVEGSETIVAKLHRQFPQLKDKIVAGDFGQELPAEEFDLIVDRAAVSLNDSRSIRNCLRLCHERLARQGRYIGVDWYSADSTDHSKGVEAGDRWTRTGFTEGCFAGLGEIHFSDKSHLLDLLRDFRIYTLEHKTIADELSTNDYVIASWNFVAGK